MGDHRELHVRTHSCPTRRSSDLTPSKPAAPSAPAAKVKVEVADNTKSSPAVPKIAQKPAANGNSLIQLGAYGSKAVAEQAWTALSKRFDYLAGLDRKSTRLNSSH